MLFLPVLSVSDFKSTPNRFQHKTYKLIQFPFPFFLLSALPGCHCHVEGSANRLCNRHSGQCVCKPNVTGRQCNKCAIGYWNVQSGVGCVPCSCDPNGSDHRECDMYSGQCFCKPGVEGIKCDRCQQGFYGFSSQGCKSKYYVFNSLYLYLFQLHYFLKTYQLGWIIFIHGSFYTFFYAICVKTYYSKNKNVVKSQDPVD